MAKPVSKSSVKLPDLREERELTLLTQAEVAEILGITHQRVWQIEQQALLKIRRAIETDVSFRDLVDEVMSG